MPRFRPESTPIDRLYAIMREAGFNGRDKALLGWMLARGVVTAEWIFRETKSDAAYELAVEVAEQTRAYLDWDESGKLRSKSGKLKAGRL